MHSPQLSIYKELSEFRLIDLKIVHQFIAIIINIVCYDYRVIKFVMLMFVCDLRIINRSWLLYYIQQRTDSLFFLLAEYNSNTKN